MESGGPEAIITGTASPKSFMLLYFWLTTLLPLCGEAGYNPKKRVGVFAPLIRGAHEERGNRQRRRPL